MATQKRPDKKAEPDAAPGSAPAAGPRLQRWLGAWVSLVQRRKWIVLAVAALLGAGMAAYTGTHLNVDTNTENMLSAELPWRRAGAELDKLFPQQSQELTIVIDGDTPERAAAAQRRLMDALQAEPELYVDVYALDAMPYFRHNGLLFLDTAQLHQLSDALLQAQPFLGTLAHDPSLKSLFTLLARAAGNSQAQDFDLGPPLQHISTAVSAAIDGKTYQMSWQQLTNTGLGDQGDATRRFIEVNPKLDFNQILPAQAPIDGVRAKVRDLQMDAAHGLRVRLTGPVALEHEELLSAGSGAVLAFSVGLLLVVILLFVALRSWQLVLAALLTLIYGLIATACFAAAAVGHLNLISVAFGVLYIGLGIDYALYLCMQYRERLHVGDLPDPALRQAAHDVGGFMAVCAMTTSIGFFAFIPTAFTGIAELGLISGVGMFISLLVNLTLLPALIAVLPKGRRLTAAEHAASAARHLERGAAAKAGSRPQGNPPGNSPGAARGRQIADHEPPELAGGALMRRLRPVLEALIHLPYSHTRAIWIGSVLLGLGALALVPRARFDSDPLDLRDPHSESVSTYRDLLKDPNVPTLTLSVIADSPQQAQQVAERLGELPLVKQTLWLQDFIPTDQAQKQSIIDDLNFTLGPDLAAEPPRQYTGDDASDLKALDDLRSAMAQAIKQPGSMPAATLDGMKALADQLRRFQDSYTVLGPDSRQALLARLRESLLGALPEMLGSLHDALQAQPVTRKDLPPDLVSRWVSADGHYRVDIWPREVLDNPKAMHAFVDQVRTAAPQATGAPIAYLESGAAVVKSFRQAFAYSLVAITLLLLALLRSAVDMLLVMVPLLLAGLLTVAGAVLFGVPFNFANVIALPLILGVGVDYGVYIVQHGRNIASSEVNILKTASARAVLFGALITVANFGNLALSPHPGTRSMGIILAVGLTMTLLCALVLLPGLLALRYRLRSAAASASPDDDEGDGKDDGEQTGPRRGRK